MPKASLETITNHITNKDIKDSDLERILNGLKARYDEPWRHYHTFEHPLELFDILIDNLDTVNSPEIVAWSMLYHDSVYDPTAENGRNEELSAQIAESELPLIIGKDKACLVANYTRATLYHGSDEINTDLDFFLDADLTILGSKPERYDKYARDIRREYKHVPDEDYRLGRIAILQSLSNRVEESGLFRTELFRETYEDQAQNNIARETDQLKATS